MLVVRHVPPHVAVQTLMISVGVQYPELLLHKLTVVLRRSPLLASMQTPSAGVHGAATHSYHL